MIKGRPTPSIIFTFIFLFAFSLYFFSLLFLFAFSLCFFSLLFLFTLSLYFFSLLFLFVTIKGRPTPSIISISHSLFSLLFSLFFSLLFSLLFSFVFQFFHSIFIFFFNFLSFNFNIQSLFSIFNFSQYIYMLEPVSSSRDSNQCVWDLPSTQQNR